MSKKETINISIAEAEEVFELLEKVNELFHQPMHFKNTELVEKFAEENYQQIEKLYYEVVWNWLPKEIQDKYENR
jgi:hypothetical protein